GIMAGGTYINARSPRTRTASPHASASGIGSSSSPTSSSAGASRLRVLTSESAASGTTTVNGDTRPTTSLSAPDISSNVARAARPASGAELGVTTDMSEYG